MRPLLLQVAAVTVMNLKSLPQRLWLSLSTIVAVALVVVVLLAFLAMANGFQRTLASSGSPDVAVVMRGGSQSEVNSVVTRDLEPFSLAAGLPARVISKLREG